MRVHGVLLAASGLPQPLHRKLFQKLTAETFDGGNYFQVEPVEDGRQRRLVLTEDILREDSDVFLVDHAWTFRLSDAYKQVQSKLNYLFSSGKCWYNGCICLHFPFSSCHYLYFGKSGIPCIKFLTIELNCSCRRCLGWWKGWLR